MIVNDKVYWDDFYKSNPDINKPSDFAKSITDLLCKKKCIVDVGCGNGRDSVYFAALGLFVIGIDESDVAINNLNDRKIEHTEFICGDFTDNASIYSKQNDYFYSRFTLHAVSDEQQRTLLINVYKSLLKDGLLFIEVRSVLDDIFGKGEIAGRNAYIYNGHYRRFIVNDELISELKQIGFEIIYNEQAKGFAKFGDDDPMVIRCIAKKIR